MPRRITIWIFAFLLLFSSQSACAAPPINADYAILIEASTGKELFAKNPDQACFPASTTKILTLITALENNNRKTSVTISRNAAGVEGSSAGLQAEETYQLQDLFYGMMLPSGNDAATAIAEHIGNGSVARFSSLMNSTAHSIGTTNSNFVNPSGLPDSNHYTTPRDMAKITSYALRNPLFAEIVGTYEYTWTKKNGGQGNALVNTNKFLVSYDGANGVKTGYTNAAQRCLVASAKKNGVQLVAVLFHSGEYCWNDAWTLMDYGFSLITPREIYKKGDSVFMAQVYKGKEDAALTVDDDLILPVTDDDLKKYTVEVAPAPKLFAPVKKGQDAGFVRVLYQGKEVRKLRLVIRDDVQKS